MDAIVPVGTNLSAVRLCASAELWLGKPVIAINTAPYWHALRANGINDKTAGYRRLLEEFRCMDAGSVAEQRLRRSEFSTAGHVVLAAAVGVGPGITGLPIYTTGQFIRRPGEAFG